MNKFKDDKVKNKNLINLNKITIITLFYEFVTVFLTLVWMLLFSSNQRLISPIPSYFPPFLYNYSMYIMLDRNKKSYEWFLNILYKFRLYFVCYCCCNKRINQQWNDIQSVVDNTSDICPQIENTEYDISVNDISVHHGKIATIALSIETTINQS